MAREKAIYTIIEEFGDLVKKIIEINAEDYGHIDPLVLRMVAIQNKEPSYWYKIRTVKNPIAMFCSDVRYVAVVFESVWQTYTPNQKAMTIINILESLEPDEDEPKVRSYNLNDHERIVKTFGVGYMENADIQDLLKKAVDWR